MARKKGTIKSFAELWKCHENLYKTIFCEALKRLKISQEQSNDEDAISEALCPVLNSVCFEHENDVAPPSWEKPIQPVTKEELTGGKRRKRPDFTCNLINKSPNSSAETYIIPFHVECKRLGKTKGSWNLNENYVIDGIDRFDSNSHEYGKRAHSGMMIGYIVNMEANDILDKVNEHISTKFQKLTFLFTNKVSTFKQKLRRMEVEPKEFTLIHLWANLTK